MTVGLALVLLEGALVELAQTEGALEVLRVELARHGRHAAARDRPVARGAQGPALLVVVRLAVRLALVVEEGAARERPLAVLQRLQRWRQCKLEARREGGTK